jgi:hypothetical protein
MESLVPDESKKDNNTETAVFPTDKNRCFGQRGTRGEIIKK